MEAMAAAARKPGKRVVMILVAVVAIVAIVVGGGLFLDSGGRRPSEGGRPVELGQRQPGPQPALAEPAAEASPEAVVRSVVDAERGPEFETAGAPAEDPAPDLEAWRSSRDAVLAGQIVASRGMKDWRGWQVYITSFAPPPFLYGNKNTTARVDARTGAFEDQLPVGPAEVLWYHSVVGKGPTHEVVLESGSNSLTLDYTGPDPLSSIFVDVGSGTISASHLTATLPETGQVYFATEFLDEGRFVIPGLERGTHTVRIDAPGYALFEAPERPGNRIRVDLEEL